MSSPGRKTRLSRKTRNATDSRNKATHYEADERRFALAVLTEGISFAEAVRFCLKINVSSCSKYDFDKIIYEIGPKIEAMAMKSCEDAYKEMPPGGIGTDGSWNARRNGDHLFFTAMSLKTEKVIFYRVVSRNSKVSMIPFDGKASNTMETCAVKDAAKYFRNKEKITFRVTDLDVKSEQFFSDEGIESATIQSFFDGGHMKKHIEKEFNTFRKEKQCGNIGSFVAQRFAYCISFNAKDIEERVSAWRETPTYFTSKNSIIPAGRNPLIIGFGKAGSSNYVAPEVLLENLDEFIKKYEYAVRRSYMGRTCICEAINARKAAISKKSVKSGYIFRVKMAIVVLMWNDPLHFYDKICQECNIPPICEELHNQLQNETTRKVKENENRKSPEYHRIRAIMKTKKKEKIKAPAMSGHSDIHKPQIATAINRKIQESKIPIMYGGIENTETSSAFTTVLQYLFHSGILDDIDNYYSCTNTLLMLLQKVNETLKCKQIIPRLTVERMIHLFNFGTDTIALIDTYKIILNQILILKPEDSFICEKVTFLVRSEEECSACGFKSTSVTQIPFIDISIMIDNMSLYDHIKIWEETTSIKDCPQCKTTSSLTLKKSIVHYPCTGLIVCNYNKATSNNEFSIMLQSFIIDEREYTPFFIAKEIICDDGNKKYISYSKDSDGCIKIDGARSYKKEGMQWKEKNLCFIGIKEPEDDFNFSSTEDILDNEQYDDASSEENQRITEEEDFFD